MICYGSVIFALPIPNRAAVQVAGRKYRTDSNTLIEVGNRAVVLASIHQNVGPAGPRPWQARIYLDRGILVGHSEVRLASKPSSVAAIAVCRRQKTPVLCLFDNPRTGRYSSGRIDNR